MLPVFNRQSHYNVLFFPYCRQSHYGIPFTVILYLLYFHQRHYVPFIVVYTMQIMMWICVVCCASYYFATAYMWITVMLLRENIDRIFVTHCVRFYRIVPSLHILSYTFVRISPFRI